MADVLNDKNLSSPDAHKNILSETTSLAADLPNGDKNLSSPNSDKITHSEPSSNTNEESPPTICVANEILLKKHQFEVISCKINGDSDKDVQPIVEEQADFVKEDLTKKQELKDSENTDAVFDTETIQNVDVSESIQSERKGKWL